MAALSKKYWFLPTACALAFLAHAGAAPQNLSWQPGQDTLALKAGDRVVWQFNYGKQDGTKPFFHPVAVAGGPELTEARPADHQWHYGLWFSWKLINNTNYWEHDPKTGYLAGITEWSKPRLEQGKDFSATIALDLDYHPLGGTSVLTEHRLIKLSAPAADGSYAMDWESAFKAGPGKVVFDRTPPPGFPEGKPHGGYAGFSVRFAPTFQQPEAMSAEGPIQFSNTYRGKSLAMDYSGVAAGRPYGIAILDHAQNLNHPTPWYVIRNAKMTYINPSVIHDGPHTIAAGESFVLRYRLIVHPERWTRDQLQKAIDSYAH